MRFLCKTNRVNDFIHPIADREPLAWIVREQRTALPVARKREAEMLSAGDRLFLYTTRGCFHNPTRDRSRVIGMAVVMGKATSLARPVRFGGRDYAFGVGLQIKLLAPCRTGVEIAPLVDSLATFPNPRAWSAWLRRSVVPLAGDDGDLLASLLIDVAPPYPEAQRTYEPKRRK